MASGGTSHTPRNQPCETPAAENAEHTQQGKRGLWHPLHEAADLAAGFSQAVVAAAAPAAAEPGSIPSASAGAGTASPGAAGQHAQPDAEAQQQAVHDGIALQRPSEQSGPAAPQPGSPVWRPSSPAASDCAAQHAVGFAGSGVAADDSQAARPLAADAAAASDGRETPPVLEPQLPSAGTRKRSADSSLDMERSPSLVWVSAPSMDLGDCRPSGCSSVPGGSSDGGVGGVGDAADAGRNDGPEHGDCCGGFGNIEVAADYADGASAPAAGSSYGTVLGADVAAGSSYKPPGFSWYHSVLPQNWVGW